MGSELIIHEAEGRMGYVTVLTQRPFGLEEYLFQLNPTSWSKKVSRLNIFPKLKLDFNPFTAKT